MTTTTQDQDQCRAEFEAWANGILALAYEREKGRYVDGYSETCFQCWQAARRTQPPLKALTDEEITEVWERYDEGIGTRQEPPPRTGWRNGLLQDQCKPLGKWFASRIDARWAVRKACELIRAEREKENAMSNEAQTPDSRFTGEAQEPNESAAFQQWFKGEQGKPYQGMWEFARAAWVARAAITPETGNPASADDERDAARYRWLRDVGDSTWAPISQRPGCTKETIDKAIDAARAQQEAG